MQSIRPRSGSDPRLLCPHCRCRDRQPGPGSFPRNQTPVCLARSSSRSEWCTWPGLLERWRKSGGARGRAPRRLCAGPARADCSVDKRLMIRLNAPHLLLRLWIIRCRKSQRNFSPAGLSGLRPIAPAAQTLQLVNSPPGAPRDCSNSRDRLPFY